MSDRTRSSSSRYRVIVLFLSTMVPRTKIARSYGSIYRESSRIDLVRRVLLGKPTRSKVFERFCSRFVAFSSRFVNVNDNVDVTSGYIPCTRARVRLLFPFSLSDKRCTRMMTPIITIFVHYFKYSFYVNYNRFQKTLF